MSEKPLNFEAWIETVHSSIRNDPLWNFQVYPKTLFIYDLVWEDCEYLLKDVRGRKIAEKLSEVLARSAQILRKATVEDMAKTMAITCELLSQKLVNHVVGIGKEENCCHPKCLTTV